MMAMSEIWQLAYESCVSAQGKSARVDTDLPLGDTSGLVHSRIEKRPGSASWR